MLNRGFIVVGLACLLFANILLTLGGYLMHKDISDKDRLSLQQARITDRDVTVEIRTLSSVNKEAIETNRKLIQDLITTVHNQEEEIKLLRWRLDRCIDKNCSDKAARPQ